MYIQPSKKETPMNPKSQNIKNTSSIPRAYRAAITLLSFAAILAPTLSSSTPAPQASTLATLAQIREAWVQDLHAKQLDPILKFYSPDAAFLQPTGERVTGSAALRALFQTVFATFNSDLALHCQNLETSGDLAYDSGDYDETLTVVSTGAKMTARGSYLLVYKRQPGPAASWQIVQQVFTGTPPKM